MLSALLAPLLPLAASAAVSVSTFTWVIPDRAPAGASVQASNNNVALAAFEGRLFMAWRTAPNHFASPKAVLQIASSADEGRTWTLEASISRGRDLREPSLVEWRGKLYLYVVQLGTKATAYEPGGGLRMERLGPGRWSEPVEADPPGAVVWDVKARLGRLWRTIYRGDRYRLRPPEIELSFESSLDGLHWSGPVVYRGGVCEAAFEFDEDDVLWAVARNEDGDASGFGSLVAWAPRENPAGWIFPQSSDPSRYDSPRLFEQGGELYLLARRDPTGPYDRAWSRLPFPLRRLMNLARYWLTAKRTALYRLDRKDARVVWLLDLPSAGDTAFPAAVRVGPRTWLVANYTSPLDKPDISWVRGQLSRRGTRIYLTRLVFDR